MRWPGCHQQSSIDASSYTIQITRTNSVERTGGKIVTITLSFMEIGFTLTVRSQQGNSLVSYGYMCERDHMGKPHILPCLDSEQMAASRRQELNIPSDLAAALARSAVEASREGFYVTEIGQKVVWR